MATFTNFATLTYNGNTINSNTVTGNLTEVLEISKTAVGNTYEPGDNVTYVVSITNSGATPFTGITLTDNLGTFPFGNITLTPLDYVSGSVVYYQNGTLQTAPVPTSENPLTFAGITVPAGGNVTLVYETEVNNFAPLDSESTIINEATANSATLSAPITATETITVAAEPDLTISKAICPANVTENSQITYTFTIQNTGNTEATATDNVVVTDTFNPILSGITVTLNGTTLATGEYTYNEATGEFSTLPGVITVPEATYARNPETGIVTITPGVTEITVTGTI